MGWDSAQAAGPQYFYRRFKPRRGITIHRGTLATGERTLRNGLWLTTSLKRTLFDAARAGTDPEQLLAAAREARERALLGPDALAALTKQHPYTMLET